MGERPILFSGPMVRAILAGRKSQTRRVVKWPSWLLDRGQPSADAIHAFSSGLECAGLFGDGLPRKRFCRPCNPDDRLWVRETWADDGYGIAVYRASDPDWNVRAPNRGAWRPSIYMPRWASRITLEVTDVRVERLQDISEADAKAEGCPGLDCYRDPRFTQLVTDTGELPQEQFRALWDSINGKRGHSWESNPWVWVVSFKRVEAKSEAA